MRLLFRLLLLSWPITALAEPLQIAVAANFAAPLRALVEDFQQQHPQTDIALTVGSTGKLAAQIRQGAPYDLFLAADERRPGELARDNIGQPGSVRTYALGRLALWTPQPGVDLAPVRLSAGLVSPLSMANPRTAPYGAAARAVIDKLSLPDSVTLVQAENVGQSYHFAHSGAAAAAFVSYSQVKDSGGSLWRVPDADYPAIVQKGILLTSDASAQAFYAFLFTAQARNIIRQHGYRVPDAE